MRFGYGRHPEGVRYSLHGTPLHLHHESLVDLSLGGRGELPLEEVEARVLLHTVSIESHCIFSLTNSHYKSLRGKEAGGGAR